MKDNLVVTNASQLSRNIKTGDKPGVKMRWFADLRVRERGEKVLNSTTANCLKKLVTRTPGNMGTRKQNRPGRS